MTPLELPTLRVGNWNSVTLEPSELAGTKVWAVSIRSGAKSTRRRWFPAEGAALCYAADQADALELPLIDLRHGGPVDEG